MYKFVILTNRFVPMVISLDWFPSTVPEKHISNKQYNFKIQNFKFQKKIILIKKNIYTITPNSYCELLWINMYLRQSVETNCPL
jgi:hypothetical protein